MGYEVVRYRRELRPGVIALLEHLGSSDAALNDAWFRWKHEENPYTPEPVAYVVLCDGEPVAMRAFHGARWRLNEEGATQSWPCACDLVVAPSHRGAKLSWRIMDFALADLRARGTSAVLSWSANPITYTMSRRMGWQLAAPYLPWKRQTARARRWRALGDRMRRWPLAWRAASVPGSIALRRQFRAMDAAWQRASTPFVTLGREPRPDAMGALACRTSAALMGHERDAAYYRWRFGNPMSDYRFLYFDESDLEAFIVLHRARGGRAADFSIVDWEASRPELLETMLSALVEAGGYDTLSIWSSTLSTAIRSAFERHGFAAFDDTRGDPDYRPGLLAIGCAGSTPEPLAPWSSAAHWNLRMVYSDYY